MNSSKCYNNTNITIKINSNTIVIQTYYLCTTIITYMAITKPVEKLWQLIITDRKDIYSIYFYAILSGLVQLTVPIGVQAIIGFVMGASMVTSIYVLIFVVVLGVLCVGIMQINQMKIIEKIQQNIFARNAFLFAEKIPSFDLKKIDNYYLPEKVNVFFDTLNVQKGLNKILLDIPAASIQILFGLILLALYHPLFIVFGILLVAILWVILKLTSSKGLETSLAESKYKYKVVAWLQEMARVIKSFKYSQGTHLNLLKTDTNVINYITSRTSHFKVLLTQYRVLVFFKVAITTAMLVVGTYLLLEQQLNIGEFIAAEIVILTVINAVEKLITSLDSVYDVITGVEKLSTIGDSPTEISGASNLLNTNGISIEMNNVSFGYNNANTVLHNINMTIPANTTVVLSGTEGSGKTTFLQLLSGSYQDFEGSITVNNIPISNYTLASLRSNTGLSLNMNDVFEGTVYENISLGRSHITPQLIMDKAHELGIQNFTNNLPSGLDTVLDSGGKKMPSSMLKKVVLLRALTNNPSLLLLEEPLQGLPTEQKQSVAKYLTQNPTKATIIIVSNDPLLYNNCSLHYQIENGYATLINTNNK